MSFVSKDEMKLKTVGPPNKDIDAPVQSSKSKDHEGKSSDSNYAADEGHHSPEYNEYDIKDGYETLKKAEEIKKKPKLMHHINKHAETHVEAISSIKGLKEARQKMFADKQKEMKEDPKEEASEYPREEKAEG